MTGSCRRMMTGVLSLMLVLCGSVATSMAAREEVKVSEAVEVLREITAIPETGIPPALLADAQGIAIIPGVIKVGFFVGGRYGTGVLSMKEEKGWSSPVFISLTGGSFGMQIGAQSTDVILVFKSQKSIEGIMKGKFTLGADAAIAAGPVGRRAEMGTDVQLRAEIYSYSRSRGAFAGISLEGAALLIDDEANASFYGKKDVTAAEILGGKGITIPASAKRLMKTLKEYAGPK